MFALLIRDTYGRNYLVIIAENVNVASLGTQVSKVVDDRL